MWLVSLEKQGSYSDMFAPTHIIKNVHSNTKYLIFTRKTPLYYS